MKTKVYDLSGKQGKEIELPKEFSSKVRKDVVEKVLEAKKFAQPYGPDPMAGKKSSSSGKLNHRRHVWKSQYGRGMSRVPRKRMLQRGSQFQWVAAFSPNAVGGRRAHPPKPKINDLKINKKELKIAFVSALSATADKKYVVEKYSRLNEAEVPFVIEIKKETKTKQILDALKKILGESYEVAIKERSVRAGKGKVRGRKYKSNAGMLMVIGNKEKFKTTRFDVVQANTLGVIDLAKGGLGRLTVYTEEAVKDLESKFNKKEKKE
jgi:large subunit ribosomal protein L4e